MSRTKMSARPRPRLHTCCVAMGVLLVSSALLALAGWRSDGSEPFAPMAGLPLVILLVGMVPLGWQMLCGVLPEASGAGWLLALSLVALVMSAAALASPATTTLDYVAVVVDLGAAVLGLGVMHAFSLTRSLVIGRP